MIRREEVNGRMATISDLPFGGMLKVVFDDTHESMILVPEHGEQSTTHDAEMQTFKKVAQLKRAHRLDVVIENPKESMRRGKTWEVSMPNDYGYIRRVPGADGDDLDCFVGPNPESQMVFIIDQKDMRTGAFDEHKVMLGYDDADQAAKDYQDAYTDGQDRIMSMQSCNMAHFKNWMKTADLRVPYNRNVPFILESSKP